MFTAKELAAVSSQPLIFINSKKCRRDFSAVPAADKRIYSQKTFKPSERLQSIYHLATANYIFVDTYEAALSAIRFKKNVTCVQMWHAAGAVKKFGWSDPETAKRSPIAQKRFQRVYDQFQYIPVGSQKMADIFSEAFHMNEDRFLYTGVPQTDFYFDEALKKKGMQRVLKRYPAIKDKKVVLYAPTFRKDSLQQMKMEFDINLFLEKLDEDYVLLIRAHPSISHTATIPAHPRVIKVSGYPQINDLLLVSDILVTDYSSIPVEFSFLQKKMIFFTYDMDSYSDTQGLWSVGDLAFPGPVAVTTSEVIAHIKDPAVDYGTIERFREHWNMFSAGSSSRKLIEAVYDPKDLSVK